MNRYQALMLHVVIVVVGALAVGGITSWFFGGMSLQYIEDSIVRRSEQRQRLFDLQGPQEAYRRTLESDGNVVIELNNEGFLDLFLGTEDVLSFVLDVEVLANRAGIAHSIADRGTVAVSSRRRSVPSSEDFEGLSDEDRLAFEALLARRAQMQQGGLDSIPARLFAIESVGSFEAISRFIGMLEQSLPLAIIESTSIQRQAISDLSARNAEGLPLSLQGGAAAGVVAAIEVRVFLEE